MIGRTNCTNCEHFERSYPSKLKKIKSKAKLTLASTKIILIIFTTANESSNPAHCLLMAFSDLEMKKKTPKKLREKHYADARASTLSKNSHLHEISSNITCTNSVESILGAEPFGAS